MKKSLKRLLSVSLAVLMVISVLPIMARADEAATWTQVESVEEITGGAEFVLVAKVDSKYFAVTSSSFTSSKLAAAEVTVSDGELSGESIPTWQIDACDDGISLSNGSKYLDYSSGTNFKWSDAATKWTVEAKDGGTFRFTHGTTTGRSIAYGTASNQLKFAPYDNTQTTGYVFDLLVFKKGGEPAAPTAKITSTTPASGSTVALGATVKIVTDPAEATLEYTEVKDGQGESWQTIADHQLVLPGEAGTYKYKLRASMDEYTTTTKDVVFYVKDLNEAQKISDAKAGAEGELFKVKGVVTFVDGKNVYLQDETGGICAFADANVTGIERGNVVTASGSYKVFNKLPELANATVEKTDESTPALNATEKKLNEVTDADVCTYIKVVGAKVTDISGDYITLSDDSGETLKIYKAPVKPEGLSIGDTVTVTAAVGMYNSLQLRTMVAGDIEITAYADPAEPTATPASGDIEQGGTITLKCATTGATFQTAPSAEGEWTDLDGSTITIPAETELGPYTIYVRSKRVVGGETKYSDVVTLTYTVKASGTSPEPEKPTEAVFTEKIEHGDQFIIYSPGSKVVLSSEAKPYGEKMQFAGIEATPADNKITLADNMAIFTAHVDGLGYITFVREDGKYLTSGATGSNLTAEDVQSQYSLWELEQVEGSTGVYKVKNVNAKYGGTKPQYLECISGSYTTYSDDSSKPDMYKYSFYKTGHVELEPPAKEWRTDSEVVDTIAQWGGGGPYDDATNATDIKGDVFNINDMLDSAVYTAVVGGENVKPFTTGTSKGSDVISAWYLGGTGIGSGENDYAQFALSTAGYGDMTMSFRMRASKSGPGELKAQYSTDGGSTFHDITTGTYKYAYTAYGSDGSYTKEGSGAITDGLVKTSLAAEEYVSFTLDIPAGAENAKSLLIRFVPTGTRASGSSAVSNQGTLRIDTVKLMGSPIVDDTVVGYVAVDPDGKKDQATGTELTMSTATVGATIKYRFVNPATGTGDWQTYSESAKPKLATLPADLEVKAEKDGQEGVTRRFHYASGTVAMVNMKPNGGGISTASGSAEITLTSATEGATIHYASYTGDRPEEVEYQIYSTPITVQAGFGTLTVEAYATKDGFKDSVVTTRTFTERTQDRYQLYFGQMHSHTSYSDGAGTAQEAYAHVKGLSQADYNMDFLSVTDHSNSFDDAGGSKTINDAPEGQEWNEGKALAKAATTEDFVGIFGYEMTWSNGLGHINTFNTTGYQDRTQSPYTSFDQSLQNYYAMLKTAGDSISQFNHPGTTFGDFSDFAHYDTEIDKLITLIEVGNGEGAIGSSGYFPSYEYYTRALDKGWHVAPTNNQDNHKGGWGSANNARDVVLVDELTESAIYDAMRNYRVYATEDINLEIYYTLDGNIMGTILDESAYEGKDTATIRVELNDPNTGDQKEATVQVIVNGGKVAAETKTTLDNKTVEIQVPTTYNYYYIKVVEADGDIAVTAPVWIGAVEAIGVSTFEAENPLTIVNEEQSFTMSMYNNEEDDLIVTSVTVTDENGKVVASHSDIKDPMNEAPIGKIPSMGTAEGGFTYTFTSDGVHTFKVVVAGTLKGQERTYEKSMEVTAMPADLITKVIVDGTHFNDYVTGYYGGQTGNMTALAGDNGVKVEVVKDKITSETLEGCSLLVISSPAKRSDNSHADAGDYSPTVFDDEFIAVVKKYVEDGGSVVLCGIADYQDRSGDYQTSTQINKILDAIGSTMRLNDDQVIDDVNHANQNYRLYPTTFNSESKWCTDVLEGQEFSFYSGCSVDIGSGDWLVKGWETTYSTDADKDGGGIEIGNDVYMLGAEDTQYGGTIFAAGTMFLSDYEVKTEAPDNIFDKKINRSIYENILKFLCAPTKTTDIAKTREADLNKIFVVEGYVTAGRENPNNAFFDAIYIQDATGGTCVFPYSTDGLKLGTKVRVLGYTDAYQGDRELQVISLTILSDAPQVQEPKEVTTKEAADYTALGGQLLKVSGTVSNVVMASGRVSQFDLTDSSGTKCTIFIDGYIWGANGEDPVTGKLQAGATATAVGLSYLHPEGDSEVSVCVLRVRNCDEIVITSEAPSAPSVPSLPSAPDVTTGDKTENGSTTTETTATPSASVNGSSATVQVTESMGEEIVKQAGERGSSSVVIAPSIPEGVTKSEVTIPSATAADIGEKTDADVQVKTPVAEVTIPNEAMGELAKSGDVKVSAEIAGETVTVEVSAGGNAVSSVTGGVKAALPLKEGQVAVLVNADGTETVIPKSVVEDGKTYVILDGSATVKVIENSKSFGDVKSGDWFEGAVDFASSHDLVNGMGDGKNFEPTTNMNRAMLATVLWRLESEVKAQGKVSFPDVKAGQWFSEGIAWAGENGVIKGNDKGVFEPERNVTRQEMAVMMYNYAKLMGVDVTKTTELTGYADASKVDSWASDAMKWAVATNLYRGNGSGLAPTDSASRAEVATVLQRLVALIVK